MIKKLLADFYNMETHDKFGQLVSIPINLVFVIGTLTTVEYALWSPVFGAIIYFNWASTVSDGTGFFDFMDNLPKG